MPSHLDAFMLNWATSAMDPESSQQTSAALMGKHSNVACVSDCTSRPSLQEGRRRGYIRELLQHACCIGIERV